MPEQEKIHGPCSCYGNVIREYFLENKSDLSVSEEKMSSKTTIRKLCAIIVLASTGLISSSAFALDAAAAESLARQNGCLKCHGIDKKKDGPSYREVAAKYKGKAGAEERLVTHITTGEKAKFADGHEEDHKIIKTKDMTEIKNMIQWILSM